MPEFSIATLQAMAFSAGVVATAVITAAVNRWYKRPRPTVDVMSVRFGPKVGAEDTKASIDYATTTRVDSSPILPGLKSSVTIKELNDWIQSAEATVAAHHRVMEHLRSMADRPHLLNPGLDKDRQRQAILNEWVRFGKSLEPLGKAAVQLYSSEIPRVYKDPHPNEWKDPQRARVQLEQVYYNLREIDVEEEVKKEVAVKGPIGLEDRLRNELSALNIIRRFWVYLEESDIRWFFAKIDSLGSNLEQEASELIETVREFLLRLNPEFLRVEVLVRNDGERAFCVHPDAFLILRYKRPDTNADTLAVPMEIEGSIALAPGVARTVAGVSAENFVFCSLSPINHLRIIEQSGAEIAFDGDKLRALYDQEILPCRVGLTLSGIRQESYKPYVSHQFSFGKGATIKKRDHLRKIASNAIS